MTPLPHNIPPQMRASLQLPILLALAKAEWRESSARPVAPGTGLPRARDKASAIGIAASSIPEPVAGAAIPGGAR